MLPLLGLLGTSTSALSAADLSGLFSDTPPKNLGEVWKNFKKNSSQTLYDTYNAGVPAVQAWKDFGTELGNEMRTWGNALSIPGISNTEAAPVESSQELPQEKVVQDPDTKMLTIGVSGGREMPTETPKKAPSKPRVGSGSPKGKKPLKQAARAPAEEPQQDDFQQWLYKEYANYQKQQQELANQRQSIDQRYKVQQNGRPVNPWDNPFLQSY